MPRVAFADRIKALEAKKDTAPGTDTVSAARNRFEKGSLGNGGTSESSTYIGNGKEEALGVAEARRRILEKAESANDGSIGGVGKVVGKLEEKGRMEIGRVGEVEGVRKKLERLGSSGDGGNSDGGVGRLAGRLEATGNRDEVERAAGKFENDGQQRGMVKLASIFEKGGRVNIKEDNTRARWAREKLEKGYPELAALRDTESEEKEGAVAETKTTGLGAGTLGIAERMKAFRGEENDHDHAGPTQPTPVKNKLSTVPTACSTFKSTFQSSEKAKDDTGRGLLEELAEVKKLNAELVSTLVSLTAAFKEIEASRDELGKRLRVLENKTR